MTQTRTITFGLDTSDDYGPASVLTTLGVRSLAEDDRPSFAARVLFLPSFHPEVCLTIEQSGDEAAVSLVTLQTNLWYRRSYELRACTATWASACR